MTSPGVTRVLVLDDDDGLRVLMRNVLEAAGYDVVAVPSGLHAVVEFGDAVLRGCPFQVVVFDLHNANLSGADCMLLIRRAVGSGTFGLIVSSDRLADEVVFYERFGFNAALPKPFQPAQLLLALDGGVGYDS